MRALKWRRRVPRLIRHQAERPDEQWGGVPKDRERIVRWHETREGAPAYGTGIDATAPIEDVVDAILRRCQAGT